MDPANSSKIMIWNLYFEDCRFNEYMGVAVPIVWGSVLGALNRPVYYVDPFAPKTEPLESYQVTQPLCRECLVVFTLNERWSKGRPFLKPLKLREISQGLPVQWWEFEQGPPHQTGSIV